MRVHTLAKSTFILIAIPFSLSAQQPMDSASIAPVSPFHRGTYALSGSLTYTRSSYPHNTQATTTFSMSPLYLYFASPRFAFGGQFLYTSTESKNEFSSSRASLLGIGPQFRAYVLKSPMLVYCSLSALMTSTSSEDGDLRSEGPGHSLAAIDVGTDILFATHLSIEPFVEYRYDFLSGSSPFQTIVVGVSIATFVYE